MTLTIAFFYLFLKRDPTNKNEVRSVTLKIEKKLPWIEVCKNAALPLLKPNFIVLERKFYLSKKTCFHMLNVGLKQERVFKTSDTTEK